MKTTLYLRVFRYMFLCLLLSVGARAQYGSTLGAKSVSSLAWKQIETCCTFNGNTIGLTTDGRVYTWGLNTGYVIHSQRTTNSSNIKNVGQTAPYYVPFPAGEVVKKVDMTGITRGDISGDVATFFALSQSGKLYAWGGHNGLLGTAWPVLPTTMTMADTTRTKRQPVELTILGENTFVDFDVTFLPNYWIAIGASGKAYHNGNTINESSGGGNFSSTYAALPNPAGVDAATFKYTNVWVDDYGTQAAVYLKGNNGKIYYTGTYQSMATGVLAIANITRPSYTGTSPWAGNTNAQNGAIRVLVPVEVSFPAGEDIINIQKRRFATITDNTYALSASGKAYVAGQWAQFAEQNPFSANFQAIISAPLKNVPANSNLVKFMLADSMYYLKEFTEIAMPSGASKIVDIVYPDEQSYNSILAIADNNKVYWSGAVLFGNTSTVDLPGIGNFLTYGYNNTQQTNDRCIDLGDNGSISLRNKYSWNAEAINYSGAKKFTRVGGLGGQQSMFIIDQSDRGYYVGRIDCFSGIGKIGNETLDRALFPTPIANEQLLNCQTSPGTGGPLAPVTPPTNTAVGTIDCSKTQIAPAPVAGVPSQTTLIVSVNVTTAGTFTPITVSGSGMSLGNGITSVSTTTTGVQTFYIPLQYDGTALTNAFQFTVGSAGSCTADLTQKPNQQVTNVWSLTNCSAIVPGTLSK